MLPLLVVDVQKCFLNPYTRHIPKRIASLVNGGKYDPVLFTRFVNTPDSPYRRFLGWHECADSPQTDIARPLAGMARRSHVYSKPGLTGLPDDLRAFLQQRNVAEVTLVGIDTDMCVLKVAWDLFDCGIRPIILTDCCASTAGLQAHLAGLAVLARTIGAQQLQDAGLGEGKIAAPMKNRRGERGRSA